MTDIFATPSQLQWQEERKLRHQRWDAAAKAEFLVPVVPPMPEPLKESLVDKQLVKDLTSQVSELKTELVLWKKKYSDISGDNTPRILSIKSIKSLVAKSYGVTINGLESERRWKALVHPRMIAIHLCVGLTARSYREISRHFGSRDHTTLIHAHRTISDRRRTDPDFETEVQRLEAKLLEFPA